MTAGPRSTGSGRPSPSGTRRACSAFAASTSEIAVAHHETLMGIYCSRARGAPIEGYAFRGRRVYASDLSPRDARLLRRDLPLDYVPATQYLVPWQLLTPLPGTTYPPDGFEEDDGVAPVARRALLPQVIRPCFDGAATIREEVTLAAMQENVHDFLRRWRLATGHDDVTVVARRCRPKTRYTRRPARRCRFPTVVAFRRLPLHPSDPKRGRPSSCGSRRRGSSTRRS